MSQNAPVSVPDNDDEDLPDHLTNVLLRDDSRAALPLLRQGIPISSPPITGAATEAPATSRARAMLPTVAAAPIVHSAVRLPSSMMPVAVAGHPPQPHHVAVAPMARVSPPVAAAVVAQQAQQLTTQQSAQHPLQQQQQRQQQQQQQAAAISRPVARSESSAQAGEIEYVDAVKSSIQHRRKRPP